MKEPEKNGAGVFLVLGSGATVGSGAKVHIRGQEFLPPLDRDFWKTPVVQSILGREKYPALWHYRERISTDSLERTWAEIDLILKLCIKGIISEEEQFGTLQGAMRATGDRDDFYRDKMDTEPKASRVPSLAAWELLGLVREVFGNVAVASGDSPLHVLIDSMIHEDILAGIITFNYDTVIERLFPKTFAYPVLRDDNCEHRSLFKLHGSMNWRFSSDGQIRGSPQEPHPAEMSHVPSSYAQPEIIGATFFKQEIAFDIQQDSRAQFYKELWHLAWNELREATGLVFVGFSFPDTDFHAKALFKSACGSKRDVERFPVAYCHRGHSDLASAMREILPMPGAMLAEFSGGLKEIVDRRQELMAFLRCASSP